MITEQDIKDWVDVGQPVKLYDVPRYSIVRTVEGGIHLYFDHIDGMYSYCKTIAGEVIHLAAWTEVFVKPKGKV